MSDSTPSSSTHGDPCPSGQNFFGLENPSSTGAGGSSHGHVTPPATTQLGQLEGDLPGFQVDATDSGVKGGSPRSPQEGPGATFTQPGSYLSRDGWQSATAPVGESPEPTTHGDPFNSMGFGTGGHSFGPVGHPETGGSGVAYDSTGAGDGSARTETP